ncbi:MAG: hypothetical protein JKX95_03065 [Bacteroidia bacterium]|nr:hypothetical protein [Bacteroidia bacterium]
MKKLTSYLVPVIAIVLMFYACGKDDDNNNSTNVSNILITTMSVDIPDAISGASNGKTSGTNESLEGNEIYEHMRFFVNVGESAAEIVDNIITAINKNNLSGPAEFTFTADDGRTKIVTIVANEFYDGENWEFFLEMLDQDSSKALQVFWDTSTVKGIAILDPDKIDITNTDNPDLMGKVEYSEVESGYDKRMIVTLSGLTVTEGTDLDNMKMFVGKSGDVLDVYANSNHPNVQLVDTNYTGGRNWAFRAHAHSTDDIGVAEVGLPPSSTSTNVDILSDFSIDKVLSEELHNMYDGTQDSAYVDSAITEFVKYAKPPGYFIGAQGGYVSNGDSIPSHTGFTTDFLDLSTLSPYVPVTIRDQAVTFH